VTCHSAMFVDKILKGPRSTDLPCEGGRAGSSFSLKVTHFTIMMCRWRYVRSDASVAISDLTKRVDLDWKNVTIDVFSRA
jgi:hypothetical protein